MKLIMENWKNFQIEASQDALILEELKKLERIDEASMAAIAKKVGVPVAKVALLLSLMTGVGGDTAEAGRLSDMLGGGNADAPAQQAQAETPAEGLVKNDDGTHSYTAKAPFLKNINLTKNAAAQTARVELEKAAEEGKAEGVTNSSIEGSTVVSFKIIGDMGYATVKTALPSGS